MDEALIQEVQQRFARELHGAIRIEQGDEATVWHAETDQGPVIVHVGPTWRSSKELAWVHGVIRHVVKRVPQAIPPVSAGDGSTFFRHDGRPVTLFAFIAGEPLDPNQSAETAHSAELLARLHAALADWAGGARPPVQPNGPARWDPRKDPPELVDRDLDRWWAAARPGLRDGVVHGDYYRRNLLTRQGRVVAVVDWHEAHIDAVAAEIAWAAWEIAHDKHLRLDTARADRFLHAYGSAAPHLALAVPLMRVQMRENIRYGLTLAGHGQAVDEDYLALRLRAFNDLRRWKA